ncbi:unnamed protein product [Brassica rapa]|uniref:Uncharacterized protein n=3 Tax=Brassica TaxID=3705 RepID=A0A8D9M046_BRACM|nr:unnamed protein product [Brassica napus]CAG7893303.1 unnamed protein product [Brassica rapa]
MYMHMNSNRFQLRGQKLYTRRRRTEFQLSFKITNLVINLRSHLKVVLFFNGESLRLERLHRAVKQLRHLRTPPASKLQGWSSCKVSTSEYKFASRCAVPMRFSILFLKFTSGCDLDKLDVVQFNGLV